MSGINSCGADLTENMCPWTGHYESSNLTFGCVKFRKFSYQLGNVYFFKEYYTTRTEILHGPFRVGSRPTGRVLLIYAYNKCKLRINRLSECHTFPKGVTALQSVLPSFRVEKIIAVYSNNNSKHLNNSKQQTMHSFCIVQTDLVSVNYDIAGSIRVTLTLSTQKEMY